MNAPTEPGRTSMAGRMPRGLSLRRRRVAEPLGPELKRWLAFSALWVGALVVYIVLADGAPK